MPNIKFMLNLHYILVTNPDFAISAGFFIIKMENIKK